VKLITSLRKNNGQFEMDEFVNDMHAYERAFKYLLKNKDFDLAYKCLNHYFNEFKKYESEGILSYRPGLDYICSYYSLLQYALLMEKGIKGVVDKNKKESNYAYLLLLKRFDQLPSSIKKQVIKKNHLLLKNAYCDINDRYSQALYYAGDYLFEKKRYSLAFKFFHKGANFDCDGRQITFPYFLIGRNQDRVGDMYRDGLGVKKNITKAKFYYTKCAANCGNKYHPKNGDFLLEKGESAKAFLNYTEVNLDFRYDVSFMYPIETMNDKFEIIFKDLNNKPEAKRSKLDKCVLAMMHRLGLSTEADIDRYSEFLPTDADWVEEWANEFEDSFIYHLIKYHCQ